MRRAQQGTIFDALREPISRNGAWKSPTPQSEKPVIASSFYAALDSSGIGQADTTSIDISTYTGGELTPQVYTRPPADTDDTLTDAGVAMNARAANPSRGVTPNSPLMRRR